MSYVYVEVEISGGKVSIKEPEKIPTDGTGILTVLSARQPEGKSSSERPHGLAHGLFDVPADFNDPLPDDVLKGFEGE